MKSIKKINILNTSTRVPVDNKEDKIHFILVFDNKMQNIKFFTDEKDNKEVYDKFNNESFIRVLYIGFVKYISLGFGTHFKITLL